MKRPEETTYLTKEGKLKSSQKIIEGNIDQNKFTFYSTEIHMSSELEEWLGSWGWKIKYVDGDFRDQSPGYYVIYPYE